MYLVSLHENLIPMPGARMDLSLILGLGNKEKCYQVNSGAIASNQNFFELEMGFMFKLIFITIVRLKSNETSIKIWGLPPKMKQHIFVL
jgi:hypothetical protein